VWDLETGQLVRAILGHRNWVWSVAFAPDGKTFLSGGGGAQKDGKNVPGSDFLIRLWALPSGGERPGSERRGQDLVPTTHTLTGHKSTVSCGTFSPDGKVLATGSWDKAVKLWDVGSGQELATLLGHTDGLRAVLFTPDGKTLITASDDRTVRFWDLNTHREIGQLPEQAAGVYCLSLSPDGKLLSAGTGDWRKGTQGEIKLWDLATRRELLRLPAKVGSVWSAPLSPDGRLVATAGGNEVDLWQSTDGARVAGLSHPFPIRPAVFSPDGKLLAAGGRLYLQEGKPSVGNIRLWDLATRKELGTVAAHEDLVFSLAFAPDGRTLVSTSKDTTIKFWRAGPNGLEELAVLAGSSPVWFAVFSSDGKILATGGDDHKVRLGDASRLLESRPTKAEGGVP
jgi:WD40 repeat protein